MITCPYCEAKVIDDLNFCVECENQVRCLNCSSLLYKGKARCLKCGESLKEVATSVNRMNTYTLERKATRHSSSERIEIQASDTAINTFMGKLPIGLNTPLQPLHAKEIPSAPLPALPGEQERTISLESEAQVEGERKEKAPHPLTADNLFNKQSDDEITPSKTLRDYIQNLPSKKERQQVFMMLLVWAHRQIFNKGISREKLLGAVRHENLHNQGVYTYLSELAKNYFKTVDDYYEVNPYDGEERVKEIVQAIQNPPVAGTATEQKKAGKRGRPSGSLNTKEVEAVEPWLGKLPENFKQFDARQLSSAADWGAFGLYVLTKVLKVDQAVHAGLVYVYLVKEFPVMTAGRDAFVKRMGDSKTKRFRKNAGGAYFLTPEAEAQIKGLVEAAGNS